MLNDSDLISLVTLIEHQIQKIKRKIQGEKNPKIINFKIRSFIESLKDLLVQHETP